MYLKKYTSVLVLFYIISAISGLANKWPKSADGSKAIISYVIDANSGYTASNLALIQEAMNDISNRTCFRFIKRTTQINYLRIYSGDGCHSATGMSGGRQDISFDKNGCMIRKKIVHELIHAIGFSHMHKRVDRDNYVIIQWANIIQGEEQAFEKLNNQDEVFGTSYDYNSCMHYPKDNFSNNGEDTIVCRNATYQNTIGNVLTLSLGDARRINRMYTCPNMGIYA